MTDEMLNGVIKIQFMDMPDACAASVSLPDELIDADPETSIAVLMTSAAAIVAGVVDAGMEGRSRADREELVGVLMSEVHARAVGVLNP